MRYLYAFCLFVFTALPARAAGTDLFGGPNPLADCPHPVIVSTSPLRAVCADVFGGIRAVVAGPVGGGSGAGMSSASKFAVRSGAGYAYMPFSREEQYMSAAGKISMAAVGFVQQPQNKWGYAALGALGSIELWKVFKTSGTRKSEWNFLWSR